MRQRQPAEPAREAGAAVAIEEAELAIAPADRAGAPRSRWHDTLATIVAIGGGAVLGANARYLVGVAVEQRWGSAFPWSTLLINVAGSFVLGFYLTWVTERFVGRPTTRLFVATGFIGSFTTLSTFSYETVQLLQRGELLHAVAYAGATLLAGLLAVAVGIGLARVV